MAETVASLPRTALGDVTLICAETSAEVSQIRAMRQQAYERRSGLVLDDDGATDDRAYLFALCRGDVVLATGRVLPLPDDRAGMAQFHHPAARDHGMQTEAGRVAVASGGSPRLILATLGLGACWMAEHTRHETFIAFCRPRLARLYGYVGARDLGVEAVKAGTDVGYRFVAGRFDVAAGRALAMLGLPSASGYVRPPTPLAGAA